MGNSLSIAADDASVRLLRGRESVLVYNLPDATRLPTWRCNYIHPLIAPGGGCITEDAPSDHAHHRGIFWAWRRILVADKVLDSWAGKDFAFELDECDATESACGATVSACLHWIAPGTQRIVAERTQINLVEEDAARRLEITTSLRALVPGVALAGTDDAKAYSGPTIRFAHAGLVESESNGRRLEPALDAIETGATVDFSWRERPPGFPRRVRVSCTIDGKPWTKWVLRREPGMQNAAFPGATPHALSTTHDLVIQLSLRIES